MTVSFFLLFTSQAWANYVIKGKIESNSRETLTEEIPVVLLKIDMNAGDTPSITPIMQTKTDKSGKFSFSNIPVDTHVFYRVSAVSNQQAMGSDPIKFKEGEKVMEINLLLPSLHMGLEPLKIIKNLVVFEALESGINVTDVLLIDNNTTDTLDGRETPMMRKLPEGAVNFQNFTQEQGIEVTERNGEVQIQALVPPGPHQIVYGYNLFEFSNSLNLLQSMPKGTPSLEILVPSNNPIQVEIPGKTFQKESRNLGGRDYLYFTLPMQGEDRVEISLRNIPLSQVFHMIPGGILLVLLLAGLTTFLIKNPISNLDESHAG